MFKTVCIREIVLSVFIIAPFALLANYLGTSICIVRSFFALPCPGCGLTTAGMALLDGSFLFAAKTNILIYAFPFVSCCIILDLILRKPGFSRFARWVYAVSAAILVGYFIARIIMFFPNGNYPINYSETTIWMEAFKAFF